MARPVLLRWKGGDAGHYPHPQFGEISPADGDEFEVAADKVAELLEHGVWEYVGPTPGSEPVEAREARLEREAVEAREAAARKEAEEREKAEKAAAAEAEKERKAEAKRAAAVKKDEEAKD